MVILILFYLICILFFGLLIKFFLLLFLIKNNNFQITQVRISSFNFFLLFVSIILNFFFNAPIDFSDCEE